MTKLELRQLIKECILESADFQPWIMQAIEDAYKNKDAERFVYYSQAYGRKGAVTFEKLKNSWLYSKWQTQNANAIADAKREFSDMAKYDTDVGNPV